MTPKSRTSAPTRGASRGEAHVGSVSVFCLIIKILCIDDSSLGGKNKGVLDFFVLFCFHLQKTRKYKMTVLNLTLRFTTTVKYINQLLPEDK